MYREKAKRADGEFDEGAKSIYNAIVSFMSGFSKIQINRSIFIGIFLRICQM